MAREKKKNDAQGIDRRTYMKMVGTAAGATVGAIALGGIGLSKLTPSAAASIQIAQTPLPGRTIPKYVDPLPHFVGNRVTGTSLAVAMKEFQQMVLPASLYTGLVAPYNAGTYVWGYEIYDGTSTFGPLYPAYTIEAVRGVPTIVTYTNSLVASPVLQQYLTVDQTLHWADPLGLGHAPMGTTCPLGVPPTPGVDPDWCLPYEGPHPLVTHLHGGEVESPFDGHPDAWFTPGFAQTGPGYVSNVYTYPNAQEAATLWFHDHALGVTRLNVYTGLAGFYFLRDPVNEPANLPSGNYEIEIVIQDRMFDTNGQWFFPDIGINPEHPFWTPEFLGDTIVVNGKTWPYFNADPRRYRFRFLNGSHARFYKMRLMDVTDPANPLPGPPIWQIGTDGGLLDTPAQIAFPNELLIAPGERADVIIDFSLFAGKTLLLRNSARAPYPKGAPPDPNTTGQIMQFSVGLGPVADPSYNPATAAPGSLRPLNPIRRLVNPTTGTLGAGVTVDVTRQLTLNEVMGPGGPLEVLLNNTKWEGGMSPNAGGINELPVVGSTEQWEIINITADAHPIHLHLVQFQLLNRQRFQTNKYLKAYNAAFPADTFHGVNYPGGVFIPAYGPPSPYGSTLIPGGNPDITPYLQGKVMPPAPNEAGWKDTVIMYPGEVSRIVVRYAPQDIAIGASVPGTNDYPFDPTTDPGYVWHCHILDHEDNEMMRPYKVQP